MGRHAAERPSRGGRRAVRARRRRPPVKTALVVALLLGAGSTGTYAYWSDQVTVEGTTITSGTIDLKVDDLDSITATVKLDMTAIVPGNSSAAVFTVQNAGSAPFDYHLDAAAADVDGKGLGAALVVRVTDGTVSGAAPAQTCAGAEIAAVTGFGPDLIAPASARTLAVGASESLCVEATLPLDAATSLQAASTGVSLTFVGSSF